MISKDDLETLVDVISKLTDAHLASDWTLETAVLSNGTAESQVQVQFDSAHNPYIAAVDAL